MDIIEQLLSIIAPYDCLGCGREGRLVCSWCAPDLFPALPSKCYRCSSLTTEFSVCSKCRPNSRLKHVWISTDYSKLSKLLIHRYKFLHARAAAKDIAAQMIKTLPYFEDVILVPVPTATKRVRQRGFDHTKLLSRQIALRLKLDHQILLQRLGQKRQVGTKRAQRIKQVSGSFVVRGDAAGKNILLVDDVVTTGATLQEAARVLKLAGAKQVDAVVFAQAK